MEQAQRDRINGIHQRLQTLIGESKDPYFTQYLNMLGNQLNEGKISVDEIEAGLNRNLLIYEERIKQQESKEKTASKQVSKGGVEFKIGTILLSVVGILFILSAFAVFATNFMTGLTKGISLYVIALVVILLSELFIKKHQEKFSHGITGLGFAGLFVATIINYTYLNNFNEIITLIIVVGVTFLTLIVGWKKGSGLLRIISILGCFVGILYLDGMESLVQFFILAMIFIVINVLMNFVPEKEGAFSTAIIHLVTIVIFSIIFIQKAFDASIAKEYILIYEIAILLLLNLIYMRQKRDGANMVAFAITYGITIMMTIETAGNVPYYLYFTLPLAVVTLLAIILNIKKEGKWIPYWYFLIAIYVHHVLGATDSLVAVISILSIFIISKLLSRIKTLRVSETVVTIFTVMTAMYYGEGVYGLCFIAAALLSMLALNHWQTFYQIMITLTCLIVVFNSIEGSILLPICVAIMICTMFVFNAVKRWQGEHIKVYNICNLIVTILFYLFVGFNTDYIIFLIFLLFGITYIVFFFTEKYGLPCKQKGLWLVMFLTYMALVLRVDQLIITSIFVIAIAAVSVISGFAYHEKGVRIYGLILTILVCLKIVFFDLHDLDAMQKMILYLVVGGVILLISYIYMMVEKKMYVEEQHEPVVEPVVEPEMEQTTNQEE